MAGELDGQTQDSDPEQGLTVITKDDFIAADFEAPIRDSNNVDCWSLANLYQEAIAKHAESKQGIESRVFGLLSAVANMHFKPEDRAEPFGPFFVMDGRRGIIPADLRGDQSGIVSELVPIIQNSGLRARLADISWINNRALSAMAQQAIDAYCETVQRVFDGKAEFFNSNRIASSVAGCDMLLRAVQIARATGWKDPEAPRLKDLIAVVMKDALNRMDSLGFQRLGEIWVSLDIGDFAAIAKEAETWAKSSKLHPQSSREMFKLAASAHHKSHSDQARNRCLIAATECLVTMARAAGGKGMIAASRLADAIAELRRVPGTKERRGELEVMLRAAQVAIPDEMGVVSGEIDLTRLIAHAQRCVGGMSLARALAGFADLEKSPDLDSLHEAAQKQADENPLSSIMPHQLIDEERKVITTSPGITGNDKSDNLALRHLILRNEDIRRTCVVGGMLEPARQVIQTEQPLDTRDFLCLSEMSPFVPGNRAQLFALGFARFFGGDFVSGLHILIPQLENSLRYVLTQHGVEPSVIHSDMTQESRSLSSLLDNEREALEETFGSAIVFEIDNLFNFRGGPALRNRVAHGQMSDDVCHSAEAIYACWFVFRLCCLPLFPHWREVAKRLDRA